MEALAGFAKIAQENKTILCFGVDPDIVRLSGISTGRTIENTIAPYFHGIIEKLIAENAIAAIKPNYAFFAQYGFDGLYVLEDIIQHYRNRVPVILDAKRGDIGKTGEAYAREVYDFWGADAVTVSPYMGYDSVKPFLRKDKLAYLLCRTSNDGAKDFQEKKCGKKYIYEMVAEKAVEWDCGLVAGATSDAIKRIVKLTTGNGKPETPLLIPGIGAQGGDLGMVLKAIRGNLPIHRINASSSIAYAHEMLGGSPADAALKEAEKLNREIRKYF
ncbi:MAG: orotidine-5'-phosphate decarboxylase [Candidatus Micrarchaeota archaeon]